MDLEEVKRRLEASRELDLVYRGATLHLRLPFTRDIRRLLAEHKGEVSVDDMNTMREAIALQALQGWEGVTARTIYGADDRDEPVPFDRALAAVWLRYDDAFYEFVVGTVWERCSASMVRQEQAEKN